MPMTTATISKGLAAAVASLSLLAAYDSTLVHASDFKALKTIVMENRTDRLEEKIEELENDIAILESMPVLKPFEKQSLLKAKNRREKYLRKLERD